MWNLRTLLGLTACVTFSYEAKAHAYNEETHQALVDIAYESMVLMQKAPARFERDSQYQKDPAWLQFVADAGRAVNYLRDLPSGLPAARATQCVDPAALTHSGQSVTTAPLSDIATAIAYDYNETELYGVLTSYRCDGTPQPQVCPSSCGGNRRDLWHPGGIFDADNVIEERATCTPPPRRDLTGITLGYFAAHSDREIDDTHLFVRPTSALGLGEAKNLISGVSQTAVALLVVPFVCLWEFISSGSNCWERSKQIARDTDPIQQLEGLLPGIGDDWDLDYVGMWHHINMNPSAPADFDDRPGWAPLYSGPDGIAGLTEVGLLALSATTGQSIYYDKSLGPKRYQVSDGQDGHRNTARRSKSQWQYLPFAYTTMEPVDNLAWYGWNRFKREARDAHSLQWPLHAIGDAAAPHHVIASTGWGHRPFEDAVSKRNIWETVTYSAACPSAELRAQQWAQVLRIAEKAFRFRADILRWRAGHPERAHDIPVRDLVTTLAHKTYESAMESFVRDPRQGLFIDGATIEYATGATGTAVARYTSQADFSDQVRPYIEDSMAATMAFLISVQEVQ